MLALTKIIYSIALPSSEQSENQACVQRHPPLHPCMTGGPSGQMTLPSLQHPHIKRLASILETKTKRQRPSSKRAEPKGEEAKHI